MILSLDSTVLIDLNNHHPLVRARYDETFYNQASRVICVFAAHEVLFGARISARPAHQEMLIRRLFQDNRLAAWTMADAEATVEVRLSLRRQGQSIGAVDSLIAGQALARGWTVVTSNIREFGRVEGLNVIDWAAQQD